MSGMERREFFESRNGVALTFDDVTLQTGMSEVSPREVDLTSRFSRNIELGIPFVSAAMDTVTTSDMAIAMAKMGGLGVIHGGLDVREQYEEVRRVKLSLNGLGLVGKPITVSPGATLGSVMKERERRGYNFHTFPVEDGDKKFVGLITQNDFDMFDERNRVSTVMTPADSVITAPVGTTLKQAYKIMRDAKKKTLPLLGDNGHVAGLYLWSDVVRAVQENPEGYSLDSMGRLLVAAAVPTDETALDRVRKMDGYLDCVVMDSAQGDSEYAFQTLGLLKELKGENPELEIVVGNVTDGRSAYELYRAGADGVKFGQGPGSICTTRRETGIGTPQVTAVYEGARALEGTGTPICADGGIVNRGDPIKALAAGAESIMMGSVLAGTDEAPGEIIVYEGQRYKLYRGMGSPSALRDSASSRKRYGGSDKRTPRPEGIESLVKYTGSVSEIVGAFRDLLAKGMSYCGAPNIDWLHKNSRWWQVTNSGVKEAHPHDVIALPTDGVN